jgi:hypothetical protein
MKPLVLALTLTLAAIQPALASAPVRKTIASFSTNRCLWTSTQLAADHIDADLYANPAGCWLAAVPAGSTRNQPNLRSAAFPLMTLRYRRQCSIFALGFGTLRRRMCLPG